MSANITTHIARDLIKDQVLTAAFEIFRNLKLEFDEMQMELLDKYLDTLLDKSLFRVKDSKVLAGNKKYITTLLNTMLDLVVVSFTNWGIALYHRGLLNKLE